MKNISSFERLLTIMDELREKCPWDQKQTMESLSHLTIEETYELIDAIDIIVHIFHPEKRKFYDLEKMWCDPINEKELLL